MPRNLEENILLPFMGVDSELISIPTALGGDPAPEENALSPAPSGEERQGGGGSGSYSTSTVVPTSTSD